MSFDPAEYFRLAQKMIAESSPSEAVLRTAIGRAYYSTFLSARAKVPANLLTMASRPADQHWVVRVAMKKMGHSKIADKLDALSTTRGKCDYDMSASIQKLEAEDAMLLADNLMQLIGSV